MLSKKYLGQSLPEQSDFLAKVIIMAQSEEYNMEFSNLVWMAGKAGLFNKVSPGDPSHDHIRDLDAPPIENGISSHPQS